MPANDYREAIEQAKAAILSIKETINELEGEFISSVENMSAVLSRAFKGTTPNDLTKQFNDYRAALDSVIKKSEELSNSTVSLRRKENTVIQQVIDMNNSLRKQREQEEKQEETFAAKKLKNREAELKALQKQREVEQASRESLAKQKKEALAAMQKEREVSQSARESLAKQKAAAIEASRPYNQLLEKQSLQKKALMDLIVEGKRADETQKQYNDRLRKTQLEYDKTTAKVNQAKKAVSNFANSGLGSAVRGLNNLLGAFGVFTGFALFGKVVKEAFSLTKTLDSLSFSMRAVIKDSKELAETQGFLRQIAQDYGGDLLTITNRYIKFRAATQQAGLTAKETQKIFSTMTKAAGVLGLKKDELQGIFLALEQMVSKGKITTEELRRQLGERLPGAMDIMANSMGVTTAELDKMLKKGEVITKDVLPGFAEQVEIAFGLNNITKVKTLQAATTRLSNAWLILVDDFRNGNTASQTLMNIIDGLATNLGTIIKLLALAATGFVVYKTQAALATLQTYLFNNATGVLNITLIRAKIAAWTLAGSLKAIGTALSRNAIGIIITVLGGLYYAFKDTTKSAKEMADEMTDTNKKLADQTKAISDSVVEVKKLVKRYDELKKEAKELGNESQLSAEKQQELKTIIVSLGKAVPDAVTQFDAYNNALTVGIDVAKDWIKQNSALVLSKTADGIREQTKVLLEQESALRKISDLDNKKTVEDLNGYYRVRKTAKGYFEVRQTAFNSWNRLYGKEHTNMLQHIADMEQGVKVSKGLINTYEDMKFAVTGVRNERQKEEKWIQLKSDANALGIEETEIIDLTIEKAEQLIEARRKEIKLAEDSKLVTTKLQEEITELENKIIETIYEGINAQTLGAKERESLLKEASKNAVTLNKTDYENYKESLDKKQKELDEYLQVSTEKEERAIERIAEKRLEGEAKYAEYIANLEAEKNLEIVNSDRVKTDVRITYLKKYLDDKRKAIDTEWKEQKKLKKNEFMLDFLDAKHKEELRQLEIEGVKLLENIYSDAYKHKLWIIKQEQQASNLQYEKLKAFRLNTLKETLANENLSNEERTRIIEEFNRNEENLARQHSIELLKIEATRLQASASDMTLPQKDREAAQAALLANLQAQNELTKAGVEKAQEDEVDIIARYTKIKESMIKSSADVIAEYLGLSSENLENMFSNVIGIFDKSTGRAKMSAQEILATIGAVAAVAGDIVSSIYDNNIRKLEEEKVKNDEYYATILDNEELTEQQRSAIEAEREAKEKEIDKKKRKEQEKQAKAKKAFALFDVGLSTAQAIISIWAQVPKFDFGISAAALTGFVAGLGALQAAAILAQPIPKFEKGTQNAPEGVALVDEKVPEVHTDRFGNIKSFGSTKPNLRLMEKGDKVYPSHEDYFKKAGMDDINKIVWQMNLNSNGEAINNAKMDDAIVKSIYGMRKDMSELGERLERISKRPIHNNVKVKIEQDKAY